MENKKTFGRFTQRKKPNYRKSLLLIILLIIILVVYAYADDWVTKLFKK